MKELLQYIKFYFGTLDRKLFFGITFLAALLIFFNYHFHLDEYIRKENNFRIKLFQWFGVFLFAFSFPYFIIFIKKPFLFLSNKWFWLLLIIAPALISLKLSLSFSFLITDNYELNHFWNQVLYWPFLLIIIVAPIFLIWNCADKKQPFYGFKTSGINWKPYLIMLIVMLPLITFASTQQDFLAAYPKLNTAVALNNESNGNIWWKIFIYEFSYGSDFISIELFFRGFLILAFLKWVGKEAILPMACFYCTIHFGKPLGECISSYFGGILLGIVVYNTRSIWGGLLVHLGIAWLMEIGGYIGNQISQ